MKTPGRKLRSPCIKKFSDVTRPRVLFLIPEISYSPLIIGSGPSLLIAINDKLHNFSTITLDELYGPGADIHFVIPDYRNLIDFYHDPGLIRIISMLKGIVSDDKIHMARDRSLFYLDPVLYPSEFDQIKVALAFQREVINSIEPEVQPDLIHCNGWMTGLIPAIANQMGIPSLFTLQSVRSAKATLAYIEDQGIDAAFFWRGLFYERMPINYEETRESNPVDFLLAGIYAASYVIAGSLEAYVEIERSLNGYPKTPMRQLIKDKYESKSIWFFNKKCCV
jgi:glycogen synthase